MKPFARIRAAAVDGRVQNPFYKKDQLRSLHRVLAEHADQIQNAIEEDTAHRAVEVKIEYWLALQCIADAYASIDPAKSLQDEYAIANGRDAPQARDPVGIVVIEPSTHAFFASIIGVIVPALAAGNCVVVQVCDFLSSSI